MKDKLQRAGEQIRQNENFLLEVNQIKEMFFLEGLISPIDLKERLKNFPITLDENMQETHKTSTREKFLIIATNNLLNKKVTFCNDNKIITNLDTELHIKYMKLNNELQKIWKE
jgi:hypothetical protein